LVRWKSSGSLIVVSVRNARCSLLFRIRNNKDYAERRIMPNCGSMAPIRRSAVA
jgi:hypothetical protein